MEVLVSGAEAELGLLEKQFFAIWQCTRPPRSRRPKTSVLRPAPRPGWPRTRVPKWIFVDLDLALERALGACEFGHAQPRWKSAAHYDG